MFPNLETKSTTQVSWEQRLLKNGGKSKGALKPEYQELKFTLHRKLVDKINLDTLASIDNQRVRSEVRQALISLIDSEPTLLSSLEKQQICDEVLDEVFDDVTARAPDESWTSAVRRQTIAGSPSIIFCHVFPSSREPKICPFLVPR